LVEWTNATSKISFNPVNKKREAKKKVPGRGEGSKRRTQSCWDGNPLGSPGQSRTDMGWERSGILQGGEGTIESRGRGGETSTKGENTTPEKMRPEDRRGSEGGTVRLISKREVGPGID